jgi:hypothetical protein
MVEHHLIACGDFTPARKVLSEALLLFFGHLSRPPLYLLLHGTETLDLAQPPLNRLLAIVIGLALVGGEEDELDRGRRFFEPVKPVVIHLGKISRKSPASAIVAKVAIPTPLRAISPLALVPRMRFLRPSQAATPAMKTPKVVTTVAPVGRSQAAEATRPRTLTMKPNPQPRTNLVVTDRARRAAMAAGTIK